MSVCPLGLEVLRPWTPRNKEKLREKVDVPLIRKAQLINGRAKRRALQVAKAGKRATAEEEEKSLNPERSTADIWHVLREHAGDPNTGCV